MCAGNNYRNNALKVGKLNVVTEKRSLALLCRGSREGERFEEQGSWYGRPHEVCAEGQVKRGVLIVLQFQYPEAPASWKECLQAECSEEPHLSCQS